MCSDSGNLGPSHTTCLYAQDINLENKSFVINKGTPGCGRSHCYANKAAFSWPCSLHLLRMTIARSKPCYSVVMCSFSKFRRKSFCACCSLLGSMPSKMTVQGPADFVQSTELSTRCPLNRRANSPCSPFDPTGHTC